MDMNMIKDLAFLLVVLASSITIIKLVFDKNKLKEEVNSLLQENNNFFAEDLFRDEKLRMYEQRYNEFLTEKEKALRLLEEEKQSSIKKRVLAYIKGANRVCDKDNIKLITLYITYLKGEVGHVEELQGCTFNQLRMFAELFMESDRFENANVTGIEIYINTNKRGK